MTNKEWLSAITKCKKAGDEHLRLLFLAEEEYKRRFGDNPSNVDDDYWIDTLHYCNADIDFEEIIASAEMCRNQNINKIGISI